MIKLLLIDKKESLSIKNTLTVDDEQANNDSAKKNKRISFNSNSH